MEVKFGTDGIRGVANLDLTPELAFKLGRAGAHILARNNSRAGIVIGKDTRISGDMLEGALAAGICSTGVDVLKAGVLPTPAIAYLTRRLGAAAGVVISASHNPVQDNGIKFFSSLGYKLPDDTEKEIEALINEKNPDIPCPTGTGLGRVREVNDAAGQYVDFACGTVGCRLDGIKVVVDCANGAASEVAPRAYEKLGAQVIPLFNQPDGININHKCGSTCPGPLMDAVVSEGADLGLAHDGDADRVLAVDGSGTLVDGDHLLVIFSNYLKKKALLTGNTVVVTVMSNLGLHLALRDCGIEVITTKVGDRYVLEELLRSGARLGGEQSGHIIFLDHNTTGDGIITALQLMAVLKESGMTLRELASRMQRLPQLLVNVPVADRDYIMQSGRLAAAIKEEEAKLGDEGRILVRPSGTEALVRIMAEGRNMGQLQDIIDRLSNIIKEIE